MLRHWRCCDTSTLPLMPEMGQPRRIKRRIKRRLSSTGLQHQDAIRSSSRQRRLHSSRVDAGEWKQEAAHLAGKGAQHVQQREEHIRHVPLGRRQACRQRQFRFVKRQTSHGKAATSCAFSGQVCCFVLPLSWMIHIWAHGPPEPRKQPSVSRVFMSCRVHSTICAAQCCMTM